MGLKLTALTAAALAMAAQAGVATAAPVQPAVSRLSIATQQVTPDGRVVARTGKSSRLSGSSGGLFVGLLAAGIVAGAVIAVSKNHSHPASS